MTIRILGTGQPKKGAWSALKQSKILSIIFLVNRKRGGVPNPVFLSFWKTQLTFSITWQSREVRWRPWNLIQSINAARLHFLKTLLISILSKSLTKVILMRWKLPFIIGLISLAIWGNPPIRTLLMMSKKLERTLNILMMIWIKISMMTKITCTTATLHSQCQLNTWLGWLKINLAQLESKQLNIGKGHYLNQLMQWGKDAKFIQVKRISKNSLNRPISNLQFNK